MGRHSLAKQKELELESLNNAKKKQTEPMQEGDAEEFACIIERAGNGYILKGKGEVLVFREVATVLEWILTRRIVPMKTGEIIEISLTQKFIKILPPCTDEKQSQDQLVA